MAEANRKLTVTQSSVITSGTSKNGHPWTLYDIAAVGEDGQPIDATLKSFDELPIGELVEVEVERQDDPKYGTSFMLKRAGGKGGGSAGSRLGPKVDELRERVDALEEASRKAWDKLEDLERRLQQAGSSGLQSGPSSTAAPAAPPAAAPDDDIPF